MGFWDSEVGDVNGSEKESFSSVHKTIPDGTKALAEIVDCVYGEDFNGAKRISLQWKLIDTDCKGLKTAQHLVVFSTDAKKRHRALNMLCRIFQVSGISFDRTKEPEPNDLCRLVGKVHGIKVNEMASEPNQNGKIYINNYVSEVHGSPGFVSEMGVAIEVTQVPYNPNSNDIESSFDRNPVGSSKPQDDIPF